VKYYLSTDIITFKLTLKNRLRIQSLYSKYFTFTTLIDSFTSLVSRMPTGYEVTNL